MSDEQSFDPTFLAGFIQETAKSADRNKLRDAIKLLLKDRTAAQVAEIAALLPDDLKRMLPLKSV